MHTDDHILQSFIGAKGPLSTLAVDLGMTFIALVQWIDRNADLLAAAKRAMETHIAFLSLRAEAAALVDLTQVSTSTTNEERKRKSASQLLRHTAKRLPLTNPERKLRVPRDPAASSDPLRDPVASGVPPVPTSSPEVSASRSTPSLDASMPPASMPSSLPNAECPMPNASSLSNDDIDAMMAVLSRHFNIDITSDAPDPVPA